MNSVLIVDEECSTLDFLSDMLKDEYIIHTESNANSAIEKAKETLPDLILLDKMVLEPKDMHIALQNDDIPIIILLEMDSIEDEEGEFLSDAVDFIQKPLPPVVVKSRVRNHMRIVNQKRLLENTRDELTDMFGPELFVTRLDQEWHRAMRDESHLSLLVLSVNEYNSYDSYDHKSIRDIIRRNIAEIIKTNAKRSMDVATRWDDNVFIVLLPNTPNYGAAILAEIIRKCVENTPIVLSDKDSIYITSNITVGSAKPQRTGPSHKEFLDNVLASFEINRNNKANAVHSIQ